MPAKYRPDQDAHRRLRHAAWKGDVRLARAMLQRGAKLEATDGDEYTPLLIAARWNRIEMVKVRVLPARPCVQILPFCMNSCSLGPRPHPTPFS